jgi:hypothetical protein
MSAFIIHPEHINVLIWAGLHHLRGGAPLRWLFGNPTDVAELTAENATSVGRMLLEENTASVNHLHREHHDINTSYTYRQPSHTGWSLPELLNACTATNSRRVSIPAGRPAKPTRSARRCSSD